MNAFTDMRRRYFESHSNESFAEYYLTHRCYVSEQDDIARNQLKEKIAAIRFLYEKNAVEDDILHLLADLGDQPYLDRYIVELIIQNKELLLEKRVQTKLQSLLCSSNITPAKMAHLIDICLECDLPLLNEDAFRAALNTYKLDFDVVSVLVEYAIHFAIREPADLLRDFLCQSIPENIKLQIIDYLIAADFDPAEINHWLQDHSGKGQMCNLLHDYLRFRHEELLGEDCGIVVIQTMFYGDPEFSGRGQNGGLGTLLKTLGNYLSRHRQISQVVTLTIQQGWNEHTPFFTRYDSKHLLVRLPIYLNNEDKNAFVKRELAIKRAVARFLSLRQIQPDLIHIRFLDNASKAMAALSKEIEAKLVFTLTPDPHRNMTDANADILCFKVDETLEKLNKITIGDELLAMTDGIVGIGGDTVREELELYFPQLKATGTPVDISMIGEGIDTNIDAQQFDLWQFLENHTMGYSIDPSHRDLPIMLNIGRLNEQKGQQHLLKAWGDSLLWQDYNLLIIGGSKQGESAEEAAIIEYFRKYMASRPELAGRFSHIEALPNSDVRSIERSIMDHATARMPNVYVCSSVKEEFGISILEAMSEGFLIFAPIKGGVKTYLVDGQNGFLIDTKDAASIQQGIESVLYHSNLQSNDFQEIMQRGKRTVLNQFSMDEIAKNFAELYLGLSADDGLMCVMD
ncbi:MAG: hypothetical protein CVV04_06020 [Firmicutes bacterium HGW-Firmicutes-9]|nr:MAG: hypothetical protein CVV04_06020 [Firmicutes bacterium HGW-Firmicutes-9]